MLESGFFYPCAADRVAERIVGYGRNRAVIEDALELVPSRHLKALLAHDDFCILIVPRLPHLSVDSLRREARIRYPWGECCGRRITISDESENVISTLLAAMDSQLRRRAPALLAPTTPLNMLRATLPLRASSSPSDVRHVRRRLRSSLPAPGPGGVRSFPPGPKLASAAAPEFSYIFEPTGFCEPSQSVSSTGFNCNDSRRAHRDALLEFWIKSIAPWSSFGGPISVRPRTCGAGLISGRVARTS
jgi:hypothetical protein